MTLDWPHPTAVTDREAAALTRLAQGAKVLEMGSEFGFSTAIMARVAKRVVAVDFHHTGAHGRPSTLEDFREGLFVEGLLGKVVIVVGLFAEALDHLAVQSFDFVFVDADHEGPHPVSDALLAVTMVRPGGVIAFHDYRAAPHYTVHLGVEVLVKDQGAELIEIVDTLAVVRVR